jgi:hypothetical protein
MTDFFCGKLIGKRSRHASSPQREVQHSGVAAIDSMAVREPPNPARAENLPERRTAPFPCVPLPLPTFPAPSCTTTTALLSKSHLVPQRLAEM